MANSTSVTHFVILGFSAFTDIHLPFFLLFLCIYLIILVGNGAVVSIICASPSLHTPMYFFICNLSVLEFMYSSVTLPKILANLQSEDKSISFLGCALQMYIFLALGTTECLLLALMAYDRFNAICQPLRYNVVIMSLGKCLQFSAASWISGLLLSLEQTTFIFTRPFCGPNVIDHFFCDIPPVLKLACTDTSHNEASIVSICVGILLVPFLLILLSYTRILSTLLMMSSVESRRKAYSTCVCHLTSVTLFYGSASIMYFRPQSLYSRHTDRFLALFYSVGSPMLNPLIYSLRNKEVQISAMKLMRIRKVSANY